MNNIEEMTRDERNKLLENNLLYPVLSNIKLSDMFLNKTFEKIKCIKADNDIEELWFFTNNRAVRMYHAQDCCEEVYLYDIVGDLEDLIGSPIRLCEEVCSVENQESLKECEDSFTWTFYKFGTLKGYVTLRWLGESNGYYSESVYVDEIGNVTL